jgi:hypothetical protein
MPASGCEGSTPHSKPDGLLEGANGGDQREDLRRNDALFTALGERAEEGEPRFGDGLIDGRWDDAPAVSVWEDLTTAVRSIFDDLTGQG